MKSLKVSILTMVFLLSMTVDAAKLSESISFGAATPTKVPNVSAAVVLNSIQLRDTSYSSNNTAISYHRSVQLILNASGKVVQHRICLS